mgnify:CR=1 FL=1
MTARRRAHARRLLLPVTGAMKQQGQRALILKPGTNSSAGQDSPNSVTRDLISKPPDLLQHLPCMTFSGNAIHRVDQPALLIDNKG